MGRITNAPRLSAKLDDLSKSARLAISDAVFDGATIIKTEAIRSIRDGAIIGKGHVPSRPGEPPNAETPHLDTTILVEKVGELVAQVSVNANYASQLEYGTSKMAARPFLQPAVNKTRAEVIGLFFQAIKSARGI